MQEHEWRRLRRDELRAEDPHGRRSDNDLDRQIEIESLHRRIRDLPDCGPLSPIRDILSDIAGLLETQS